MLSHLLLSLAVAAILIQVAVFSTTIYLHRCATHKALIVHPAVEWMFKMALWLTTGQCTKEWVAVHRKHHAFTDEEGDPHSPKIEGFWNVQLGNVFYYVREIKKTDVVQRYARDIKDGWWDTYLFNHGLLGLGIGTALLCLILGPVIGLWWTLLGAGIHAVMYVFVLSSSINGLCHYRRLPELRQHRDQHPHPRADHRRRGAPQQPSRLSAQSRNSASRRARSIPPGR